jgi:hypothetical protein
MAKKVEIEIDVKDNTDASIGRLRELKKELRGVAAGTPEFKKLYNEIDDLEDKIKGTRKASADWIDTLEGAGGPLGMVGGALNKLKVATVSWGAALKATGIGLLVSLIGTLVAAFSQTEGSMKKLEPLFIAFQKILGGIMSAIEPLIDGFVELAMNVMPYVTDAFRVVYSAVVSVFQSLGKLGGAVVKLIKGDFAGAWEDAKASVTSFGDNYTKASNRFIEGSNKLTKIEKENLAKQEEARKKAEEARKAALEKRLKDMDTQDKLDDALMEKEKARALASAQTEQEKLDIEKRFLDASYQARLKDLNDKMALYKKDSQEWKALQTEKIKLEGEYITNSAALKQKQKELTDKNNKELMDAEVQALQLKKAKGEIDEKALQEGIYQIKKKYLKDKKDLLDNEIAHEEFIKNEKKRIKEEERLILFRGLQDQIDAIDRKNNLFDNDFNADFERYNQKKTALEQQRALELAAAADDKVKQLEIEKKYADAIYNNDVDITNAKRAQIEQRLALDNMYMDAVGQFGQFLQQVAGKNKALAKAGLLVEQAAGVAKIVINTQAAAAKIAATSVLGFLDPRAILTYITGAISVGTAIAATVKGIKAIDGADSGGGSGSVSTEQPSSPNLGQNYAQGGMINGPRHAQGGTMIEAEGGEAIMTRGAVSMFGPLLSQLNQMGGGKSFTPAAMVSSYDNPKSAYPTDYQQTPVQVLKTYVVEGELTSAQQKQARLKDLSTI